MLDQPSPQANYPEWEHKTMPTYSNQRSRLHRGGCGTRSDTVPGETEPARPSEDAMILGTLLSNIDGSGDIEVAFKAYDAVRRPRYQHVIESSTGTGEIFCSQNEAVGLDQDRLREADHLCQGGAIIHDMDMASHKQEALDAMSELQERRTGNIK